jgi:tetratricopeptide (TPR) repeat protein
VNRVRIFIILLTGLVAMPLAVQAQSARKRLEQLVQQLQNNPDDDALRENVIRLAITIRPSPALPDEAERRMARGIAAFKAAQSVADYQNAVTEFSQATLAAPWYGDAYYNLGVAQDKAQQYDAALRSLKFALLASPGSKDIKDLTYQVEYRKEQANSPQVQEQKSREKARKEVGQRQGEFADLIAKLDGAVFVGQGPTSELKCYRGGPDNYVVCSFREKTESTGQWNNDAVYTDGTNTSPVWPTSESEFNCGCLPMADLSLSSDGQTLNNVAPDGKVLFSLRRQGN